MACCPRTSKGSTLKHEHNHVRERHAPSRDRGSTWRPRRDPEAVRRDQPATVRLGRAGEATASSDVDVLVDLQPGGGNELLRVSGIAEELSLLLGRKVDVVTSSLLRSEVSATALADAVPV